MGTCCIRPHPVSLFCYACFLRVHFPLIGRSGWNFEYAMGPLLPRCLGTLSRTNLLGEGTFNPLIPEWAGLLPMPLLVSHETCPWMHGE